MMPSPLRLENVDQVAKIVEDFARTKLPAEFKLFGDALSMELGDLIVKATPVRGASTRFYTDKRGKRRRKKIEEGGRLRGGWQGQVGTDGDTDPGENVKDRVGDRTVSKGASNLPARRPHEPFVWFNNVIYGPIIEEGRVEGPPARGSLQAPVGMVAVSVEALLHKKAEEIVLRPIVVST